VGGRDAKIADRAGPLGTRPLPAGGDGSRHRDRDLRLPESSLARNERELAKRDAAGPQPLDRFGLHVRRALHDQLGAAGGLVGLLGREFHHLKFCSHFAILSIINASFTSEPISEYRTCTRRPARCHRWPQSRTAWALASPVSPRMISRLTPSRTGKNEIAPTVPKAQTGAHSMSPVAMHWRAAMHVSTPSPMMSVVATGSNFTAARWTRPSMRRSAFGQRCGLSRRMRWTAKMSSLSIGRNAASKAGMRS